MPQPTPGPTADATLAFGSCTLDRAGARLRRDGQVVSLTPRAYDVLRYLVEHAGRLVTKQELFDAIWTDVFVGDAALKVCIREIRRALDDDAQTAAIHRNRPSSRLPFHRAGHAPNARRPASTAPMPSPPHGTPRVRSARRPTTRAAVT